MGRWVKLKNNERYIYRSNNKKNKSAYLFENFKNSNVLNECSTGIIYLFYLIFSDFLVKKLNYLFPYGKSHPSTFYHMQPGFLDRYSNGGTRILACALIIARRSVGPRGIISNSSTTISSSFDVGSWREEEPFWRGILARPPFWR